MGELKNNKETVQLALKGMRTDTVHGCLDMVNYPDVARCSENEMRPCVYEVSHLEKSAVPEFFISPTWKFSSCDIFKEVIHE